MKVRDLDNKIIKWTPASGSVSQNKSSYHVLARSLIKEVYKNVNVLEEVTIPIRRGQVAYMDFFIPLYKICIEVHGEQHFKYVPHFHGSPQGFVQAKHRDNNKRSWCEINDIEIIELNYNEDEEKWLEKLKLL